MEFFIKFIKNIYKKIKEAINKLFGEINASTKIKLKNPVYVSQCTIDLDKSVLMDAYKVLCGSNTEEIYDAIDKLTDVVKSKKVRVDDGEKFSSRKKITDYITYCDAIIDKIETNSKLIDEISKSVHKTTLLKFMKDYADKVIGELYMVISNSEPKGDAENFGEYDPYVSAALDKQNKKSKIKAEKDLNESTDLDSILSEAIDILK